MELVCQKGFGYIRLCSRVLKVLGAYIKPWYVRFLLLLVLRVSALRVYYRVLELFGRLEPWFICFSFEY